MICMKFAIAIGVHSDGLMTIVLPAAIPGAISSTGISVGKFHGVMRGVDAVRLAEREDALVDVLRRDDRRLHPLHVLGGDAEVLGRLVDVAERLGRVRLALLERELARELLAPLVDQVGDRVADPGAVPCRQRSPPRLGLARCGDGAVDVLGARVRAPRRASRP